MIEAVDLMKRRQPRKCAALAVLCLALVHLPAGSRLLSAQQKKGQRRPCVILIVVDTLRADHVSAYGYFRKTTPHIDALSGESVVFDHALSPAPWTTPAVASLFTSNEPAVLGFEGEEPVELDESFVTLAEVFKRNGYTTLAAVSHDFVGTKLKFNQGFDSFDQSQARGYGHISSPGVTDAALALIEKHQGEEFFLFVHYFDPHYDFILHPEFDFDPDYRGSIKSGEYMDRLLAKGPSMTEADRRHLLAIYDSEIRFTDEHIGRLLAGLKRLGLYDGSLIVLTSDHGEEFGERADHWVGHTKKLYQDLIHVPLIIRPPGGTPRVNVKEPAGLIDVAPTIVSRLALKTPRSFRAEGLSLDLSGKGGPESRPIFSETRRWAKLQSVVRNGWKLIYDLSRGGQELYDLNEDPGETRDLAAARPKERGELRALLWSWRAKIARLRSGIKIVPKRPLFDDAEKARLRSLGYIK